MNWLQELIKLLPILAESTDNEVDNLVARLIALGEKEIERRMAEKGQTREQILADGAATWERVISKIEEGKKLGHE